MGRENCKFLISLNKDRGKITVVEISRGKFFEKFHILSREIYLKKGIKKEILNLPFNLKLFKKSIILSSIGVWGMQNSGLPCKIKFDF